MYDKIKFITLTNNGYLDYTLNCLKSLENINSNIDLECYCIGNDGYNLLKEKGYKSYLIDDEKNNNFQEFRKGNWGNITFKKFIIIYENLLKYDYVLFTDGDIVFENKEFINYLLNNINNHELLIQNDRMNNNDNRSLCSGFMFIKSNKNTLNLFNPVNIKKYENTKLG